ncbi:MAG: hypothetical protein GF350_10080 [Chitinivibrionales bacterium]|nr:hypothetical protein [Chitinivibrionales bacterium]
MNEKIISVIAFIIAFIVPMTLLFCWIFLVPVLKENPEEKNNPPGT